MQQIQGYWHYNAMGIWNIQKVLYRQPLEAGSGGGCGTSWQEVTLIKFSACGGCDASLSNCSTGCKSQDWQICCFRGLFVKCIFHVYWRRIMRISSFLKTFTGRKVSTVWTFNIYSAGPLHSKSWKLVLAHWTLVLTPSPCWRQSTRLTSAWS